MAHTKNFAEYIKTQTAADPELAAAVAEEVVNAEIAQQVYDLRTAARLTQKELAERIGTQQSVISRVEDADYEGHSLALLKRIAEALGKKLRIEFTDLEPKPAEVAAAPTKKVIKTMTTTTATETEIRYAPFRNEFAASGPTRNTAVGAR